MLEESIYGMNLSSGIHCVAAANCPFGGLPGATCVHKSQPGTVSYYLFRLVRVIASEEIVLLQAFNLPPSSAQSNCPSGQVNFILIE